MTIINNVTSDVIHSIKNEKHNLFVKGTETKGSPAKQENTNISLSQLRIQILGLRLFEIGNTLVEISSLARLPVFEQDMNSRKSQDLVSIIFLQPFTGMLLLNDIFIKYFASSNFWVQPLSLKLPELCLPITLFSFTLIFYSLLLL